jgi:flagellar biosynthesis protein FliP
VRRFLAVLLAAGLWAPLCRAATPESFLGVTLVQNKSGASVSVPMQIVVLLTLLTVLPAILMSVTPFLRMTVVLHFLRQALGTQTTPSNQVLVGLALFLSLIVAARLRRARRGTGRRGRFELSCSALRARKISGFLSNSRTRRRR